MTKTDFLKTYRADLKATYAWAADEEKLERYMGAVRDTLMSRRTLWSLSGGAVERTWKAIGGTGKPTLLKLRALPDGDWGGEAAP